MSIIPRESPLNLSYRVAIVTSAFTPLGVIVCKTLLKANALVLGLDVPARQREPSLNAGLGTHFQYLTCDWSADGAAEEVLDAARMKFGVERLDLLVHVEEKSQDDCARGPEPLALMEACAEAMRTQDGGAIISIIGQANAQRSDIAVKMDAATRIESSLLVATRSMRQRCGQNDKVRFHVIVPWGEDSAEEANSAAAFDRAKTHMATLVKTEKLSKDVPSSKASDDTAASFYSAANVALWLGSGMDKDVPLHRIVQLNGRYTELS